MIFSALYRIPRQGRGGYNNTSIQDGSIQIVELCILLFILCHGPDVLVLTCNLWYFFVCKGLLQPQ